jgi:hypothetical protein
MFSTSGQNFRDLSHHNSENLREIRKSSQMQHSEKGKIQSATTTIWPEISENTHFV